MGQGSNSAEEQAKALRPPINALLGQNRIREALALCREAREQHPDDPWFATMQSYLHVSIGEHQAALDMAQTAIRLGTTDPAALLVIGAAHRHLGQNVQAAEYLREAQKHFPGRLDAACMLLEATAAAHGIDAARPIYAELAARLSERDLTGCWAKLLFQAGVDGEIPEGWRAAPLTTVPDWMARAGEPLAFTGERERIPIEDPVVEGGPAQPFKAMMPGYVPYAATLRDATIFHRSNMVLMADGTVLNDTVADPQYGRFVAFDKDGAAMDQRPGAVLLDTGRFQVRELDAGIMLSGSASEHYGHWVGEYLARLHYLQQHPRFAELPIVVDAGMPPQHLEYLRVLVPNPVVEIPAGAGLRCRELIVASQTTFIPVDLIRDHGVPPEKEGGFSVATIEAIRRRVREALPPPAAPSRKLYLSRQGRDGRRPFNEDAVVAAMAARGFETVFTEGMSFQEQVRLFQSAKAIVAPNGSAVLNVIFAPREVDLFLLSQRGLFNWGTYYGLMRELGYDMTFVVSDDDSPLKHASYTVPLERLTAALDAAGA